MKPKQSTENERPPPAAGVRPHMVLLVLAVMALSLWCALAGGPPL